MSLLKHFTANAWIPHSDFVSRCTLYICTPFIRISALLDQTVFTRTFVLITTQMSFLLITIQDLFPSQRYLHQAVSFSSHHKTYLINVTCYCFPLIPVPDCFVLSTAGDGSYH